MITDNEIVKNMADTANKTHEEILMKPLKFKKCANFLNDGFTKGFKSGVIYEVACNSASSYIASYNLKG